MDLLARLLGHDEWATTWLLEASRELTDVQLDQPFDIGKQTLRDTFDHLTHKIHCWTTEMAGQSSPPERSGRSSIAELLERHARYHAAFASFARWAQDEQRLDDTFVDLAGNQQSLGGTIYHVILHNAQHMLERLGVPELWDYDPQEWEYGARRDEPASSQAQEA
jgi:uncharacterized damage-inducible protein DinB